MTAPAGAAVDAARLLTELVAIPSPTGDTAAASAHLVRRAGEAGFDCHVDAAGNVVMRWGEGSPRSDVVLLGHLDTVPGVVPPRLEGGRLFGRGSVDAKGPLAAALAAVASLPRQGAPVTVVAVVDEEGPSLGARHLTRRSAPSALIVLEPSGWDTVTTAYRGCVRLRATVERPSAHHASPHPAAGDVLVRRLATLQDVLGSRGGAVASGAARAVDSLQVRINALDSRSDASVESATAALELRVPASQSVDAILASVATTLGDARIEVESACEAVSVSRGNPVARHLARSIRGCGQPPRWTSKTGTCDLNVVWPVWRCAAAVYGPGDCSLDHTAIESMSLDDLARGTAVIAGAVEALR
ncbi:MAG: M20/M25/M40 family metallo-hydrolase [Candidatus Dormibacteria bacterium]